MKEKILPLIEKHLGRGRFSGEENVSVKCPFHKGGEETKPSFSINATNGVWHCFTCKISGSFPKLLKLLGLPSNVIDIELKHLRDFLAENKEALRWKKKAAWVTKDPFLADTILSEVLLKPFELCPISLIEAGFDVRWLQWMDIGFDKNNNRIIYPIRDMYGNLAGVSGGAAIGQLPKYKVYQGRYKHPITNKWVGSDYGTWFDEQYPDYVFSNHKYIWNFDQVYPSLFFGEDSNLLIITEGFKACLWLLQHGWPNSVALMGSSMSEHQRNMIHRISNTKIILFLDNDLPGRQGTDNIARELRKFQSEVFIAQYPEAEATQPDNLSPIELTAAISRAETYHQWRRRNKYVNGRITSWRTEHQSEVGIEGVV